MLVLVLGGAYILLCVSVPVGGGWLNDECFDGLCGESVLRKGD